LYLKTFILFLLQTSGENLRILGDIFMQILRYISCRFLLYWWLATYPIRTIRRKSSKPKT